MARSAARQLALNALKRWRTSREFADKIVQRLIVPSGQSQSDRGFAQELFYGVLRNLKLLDFFISQLRNSAIDNLSRDLLRLGLYQLFHLRTPAHAAVFETVELASPHRRPLVNAMMRNAARERDRLESEAAGAPLHIRESHPEFLVLRWREAFGENSAAAICRWNNTAPPIYARINTLRIRRQDFLENNPMARPISAHSLFVESEGLPETAIARGDCYVQDPSSAVAVDLLEPQSGEMILDACAAPGGKTSYMAAITKNMASIVACDRDAGRLKRLRQNLSHLGAAHTDVIQHDWLHDESPAVLRPKQFDKILVDAPCTNTGVMRRRIDVRWRLKPADFGEMHGQQFRIVAAVIPLLRPGGVLVYSTCSLEREENQELVERFVHELPTLKIEHARSILPWRDHFDGAFAARFVLTS